jgi:endogenous inhibitor of DNA gyrase (YacG/DUF329 family)
MSKALRAKPCPICGKPADAKLTPFCSARCADIDLNRWLAGVYAFPASENDEADDAGADDAPEKARGTKV